MSTHLITTHSAPNSAGASVEVAALSAAVPAFRMECRSATSRGFGLRGMILPQGGESAWASFDAKRLAPKGGVSRYARILAVGLTVPNTSLAPNVNSTTCQSRGRTPL